MRKFRIATLALIVLFISSFSLYAASVTADEVVSTVAKAAQLVETKGEAAFEELRSIRFLDGKGYVVISDMDQICRLNPMAPSFEGKDMTGLQSADGRYFVTEMTAKAKTQDTGWISYSWMDPTTKAVAQKCLYFQKVTMPGGKTVLVQAGYYGTDCTE